MNAVNFDKEISWESITWLIEQISYYDAPLNIYIKSDGGDPTSALSAIDFINECHKLKQITLIGFDHISSAAFDLFWLTKCKKRLIPGTWALVHKTKLSTDTSEENSKMFLEQKRVVQEQDDDLYNFLKESKVVSANDLKNFNQYKDIIVGYDKLKKLLKIEN